MLSHLFWALTAAFAQDTLNVPPVFSRAAFEKADSIAAAEFAKDRLGSITVGVVSGSDLVWTKSYGFTDSARTVKATATTVYRIASVTKQFTALMLLQLVEQKRISLGDSVEKFFPEVNQVRHEGFTTTPITFVQLATMTSGLARDPDDNRASQHGLPEFWVDTMIAALPKTKFVRQPGTGYGYSNVGYAILAAALARVAGESYTSYVQRHLLEPLGMTSTSFVLSPELRKRLAIGVDFDELVKGHLNYADAARDHRSGLGFVAASGGLYSTVGDLAKLIWVELFGATNILRYETLKLRDAVPIAANRDMNYGYGLGFQAIRWGDTVAVGHSGNLAGYTSMVLYDRKLNYGVIVLRSAAGGEADAGRLAGRIFRKLQTTR